MRIRIQKINSGVMFTAMTANGKPTKRITKPIKELTWNAFEWYHQQVLNAFAERGIADIGDFKRSCPTRDEKTGILTLELNPWGFVLRHALCDGRGCEGCDSGFVMPNSGSVPTSGRTRVLACYLNPLIAYGDEFYLDKDFTAM